ncbi:unnamed protein product [Protopolystoma xenopodis]|uniref:Ion transport domain-containing protein n=1 Tax=Protopolystoma xenopodis TaxID=117903 RepID=A0A3S5CK62_9PLAT|nr:unnamed protein product [Protopolystoma xenopodis]
MSSKTTSNLGSEGEDSAHLPHYQNFNSVPQYRPEPPRPPRHILLHYSAFRIFWDWAILLLTSYTALVVPLRVAVLPEPAWIHTAKMMALASLDSSPGSQGSGTEGRSAGLAQHLASLPSDPGGTGATGDLTDQTKNHGVFPLPGTESRFALAGHSSFSIRLDSDANGKTADNVRSSILASINAPGPLAMTDTIVDIIFCIDIVLNFHTSFVGPGGEVIADPRVIRLNYLRGWFWLDLLAWLPYELIKYMWNVESEASRHTTIYYFYSNRNLQMYCPMKGQQVARTK